MARKKKVGRKPGPKKAVLNTTIKEDVLDAFRDKCNNEIGLSMGAIIEMFMEGFVNGKFKLGITNGNMNMDLEESEMEL